MKKVLYLTVVCALAFASCTKFDLDDNYSAITKENAESIFGMIDPNQTWSSVTEGSLQVTADAPLHDVARVEILTESPFMNTNAKVLASTEATKGQTVSLKYEAPNIYTRLIAACVDSKGHYYIKGFNNNEQALTFTNSANARTRSMTRGTDDYPNPSSLKLEFKNSVQSYNALRTIAANEAAVGTDQMREWANTNHIDLWTYSKWENDRLWMATNTNDTGSSDWKVVNGTVVRNASPLNQADIDNLLDIFGAFLNPNKEYRSRDNADLIRNSDAVRFYNNQLVSDGMNPITVTPIQMQSTEIGSCHLYYYYYKTEDIPSGMSETDYIKMLPKFKAIQCWHTRAEANNQGYSGTDYFKIHEYLLPFYGDPNAMLGKKVLASSFCTVDPTLYRIRNGRLFNNEYYYMTFVKTGNNDVDKLDIKYDDNATNVANQLWQIFTKPDGSKMLYNVGSKYFLPWDSDWATTYSTDMDKMKDYGYTFEETGGAIHIWRDKNSSKNTGKSKDKGLGTDIGIKTNKGIYSDKDTSIGDNFDWYLEPYTGNNVIAISDYEFPIFPQTVTSPSVVIPQGYRIGFMLRKLKGSQSYDNNAIITSAYNGCCYGFGELNLEINNLPGHFASATSSPYSMREDDPRACIFIANGRSYIGFEDGSDAQYADMIIEIGGYDEEVLAAAPAGVEEKGNGILTDYLYEEREIYGAPYMLCFEDRLVEADYDLNDVVLRCVRQKYNPDYVDLSLVAAGGLDDVRLMGITGSKKDGYDLDGYEVHEIFGVSSAQGDDRFVNTVKGGNKIAPRTSTIRIGKNISIPQFLSKIYIENMTTGEVIHVSKTGDAPFGIIIPGDFDYPMEHESIVKAYTSFRNWVNAASQFTDWYTLGEENETYPLGDIINASE